MKKVLYLVSHPIQYQAPLLRLIESQKKINLQTLFYWDKKSEASFDQGFGCDVKWDVPLLSGYDHTFLTDLSSSKSKIKKLWALWKTIDSQKYDIVWTHGYADLFTFSAIIFAKLKGLSVFVRGESMIFPQEKKSILKTYKRKIWFWFLNKLVDRFLAIGTNNRNFYLQQNIPDSKIVLCPYAVDNDFFYQKYCDVKNKIESNHPVILYASKFIERKYPIDLLNAYKMMREKINPTPYLLFIGSGETFEAVKNAASDITDNSVQFLGFKNQTELPDYFALTDIFVLPSERETWGLVVNEAMNAECAIVVSDQVGCALDLVKSDENGYVFPARDVEQLANCLTTILSDRALCEKMKKKSREIISTWGLQESASGLIAAVDSIRK